MKRPVMKRPMLLILFSCLFPLLMTACSEGPETGAVFEGETNAREGISMTVIDGRVFPGAAAIPMKLFPFPPRLL